MDSAVIFVEPPPFRLDFDTSLIGRRGYKKILVADPAQTCAPGNGDYDLVVPTDLYSRSGLEQARQRISRSFRPRAVVGLRETSVIKAAYLADAFGVAGIGWAAATRCTNKQAMIEALQEGGVPVPRFFIADASSDIAAGVKAIGGFPVVCKPLGGFASYGVMRSDNLPDLEAAVRRIRRANKFIMQRYYQLMDGDATGKVLVEAFIPGEEIAVDGYCQDGWTRILSIIDKPGVSQGPYFDDARHITPSRLPPGTLESISDTARRCVTALGLRNSTFHVEARLSEQGVIVLEVAARFGAPRCLRLSTGIDVAAIALALSLSEVVDDTPKWHCYSGNYCITPHKAGYFQSILNLEKVLRDPRIAEVLVFAEAGARVTPAPENNTYVGIIVVKADTYCAVEEALDWARRELQVVIE